MKPAFPFKLTAVQKLEQKADELVRWLTEKAISGVVRMSAAIARIYGHDLDEDRVRTFVLLALLGNEAAGLLKEVGITVGNKLTLEVIKKIPGKTITAINKLVGFKLLTKAARKVSST
jgi:hypothetical protein